MAPSLPVRCTPIAAIPVPVSGGQACAQPPVQFEVIMVSLEYQYRVKPLESASTGPAAVLTLIRSAVLEDDIPELPLLLLPVVMPDEVLDMDEPLPLAELGLVLLPHAASSNAGMAST